MSVPKQKPGCSVQTYATPPEFIEAVKAYLGIEAFGWDFAADATNTKAEFFWDEAADALSQKWVENECLLAGEWGYLNPPFARIGPWAQKCLESGLQIAFLVPASVGSNWFRDYIWGQDGVTVVYLNGRICFDGKDPYPKDLMLVLFGTRKPFSSHIWTWR